MGGQHQVKERPGVCQVPEGSEEERKMEESGSEIICGAPTTLEVKGLMMMMMTCSWILISIAVYSVIKDYSWVVKLQWCARRQLVGHVEYSVDGSCGSL